MTRKVLALALVGLAGVASGACGTSGDDTGAVTAPLRCTFPEGARLAQSNVVAGVDVYEIDDAVAPGGVGFFLVRSPGVPSDNARSADEMRQTYGDRIMRLPGVCSFGDARTALEIRVDARQWREGGFTTAFAQMLDTETACVGVVIQLMGKNGPRCLSTDPTCGPIPYSKATYDPSRPRNRLAVRVPPSACKHDGECDNGRSHCGRWDDAACTVTDAMFHIELASAQCGCVRGDCQWFVQ